MACKNCERQRYLNRVDVQELVQEQLLLEPERAPLALQQERLKVCLECPFMIGATCSKCGCYVEFRTAIPSKNCPLNYWN